MIFTAYEIQVINVYLMLKLNKKKMLLCVLQYDLISGLNSVLNLRLQMFTQTLDPQCIQKVNRVYFEFMMTRFICHYQAIAEAHQ